MIDFSKILDARVFLIGVMVAFAGLSVAGWLATEKNMFLDFHRFYQIISPEAQFYPTARELAALSREKLTPDKISVIIGGSSVSRGTGQSQRDLWSSNLQKALGEEFQVLNLALNGGGPGGQGLYMTELLLKEGRRVIFVSNIVSTNGAMTPDNGPTYRSLFFDAESRGYLSNFPERANRVSELINSKDSHLLMEYRIKSYLNSRLNFDDLWTVIGYRYLFTIWTPLTGNKPWTPRVYFPDAERGCDYDTSYTSSLDREMEIIRGVVNANPLGDEGIRDLSATLPRHIKARTVLFVERYSPYYVDKLNSFEKEKYGLSIESVASKYQSLGISTVVVAPGFLAQDFCDRPHFSSSGAQKLGSSLAPYIKQKAKELGYE